MSTIIPMLDQYEIEAIDLCEYQDYDAYNVFRGIDFVKAKSTRASLRWLLIKMGEGTWNGYNDKVFEAQISEAQAAGFDTSPYHFHHMELTSREQVAYIKGRTHGSNRGNMPVMVDFEDEDQARFKHPLTAMTTAQIEACTPTALLMHDNMRDTLDGVAQLDGVAPIGYTGSYYCDWFLWLAAMAGRDLGWMIRYWWHIATYRIREMWLPYGIPIERVVLWQDTSTPALARQVKGFPNPGRLDMNWWLKSSEEYDRMRGITAPPVVEISDVEKLARLWEAHKELHYG